MDKKNFLFLLFVGIFIKAAFIIPCNKYNKKKHRIINSHPSYNYSGGDKSTDNTSKPIDSTKQQPEDKLDTINNISTDVNKSKVNRNIRNLPWNNVSTDNTPKPIDSTKQQPEDKLDTINNTSTDVDKPKVNRNIRNLPWNNVSTYNTPKPIDSTKQQPEDKLDTINNTSTDVDKPKVNRNIRNLPWNNVSTYNTPKPIDSTKQQPKDKLDTINNVSTDNTPKPIDSTKQQPEDKLDTINNTSTDVDKPKVNRNIRNLPWNNVSTDNTPKNIDSTKQQPEDKLDTINNASTDNTPKKIDSEKQQPKDKLDTINNASTDVDKLKVNRNIRNLPWNNASTDVDKPKVNRNIRNLPWNNVSTDNTPKKIDSEKQQPKDKSSPITNVGPDVDTSKVNQNIKNFLCIRIYDRAYFENLKFQPHKHDHIFLYKEDLPKSYNVVPNEVSFGYNHDKQCCFPNTLNEFAEKYEEKGGVGNGSSNTIIEISIKDCDHKYTLKTFIRNPFDFNRNIGYYNPELYFAKYFQLHEYLNIIKFYQVYYYKDSLYIITELLKGTLEDIDFLGDKYDEYTLDKYIISIFIGIVSLHKNKIVHGDIRTDNIGIDVNGNIKIFGFGLSKKLDSGYNTMVSRWSVPMYIPPECLLSKKNMLYQIDWWAFGVVIYRLIEKQYPFGDKGEYRTEKVESILQNITSRKFRKFTNNKTSRKLKNLIRKLLSSNKNERLGVGDNAIDDILKHPYFKGQSLDELVKKYKN